jgi:hypothetical protein
MDIFPIYGRNTLVFILILSLIHMPMTDYYFVQNSMAQTQDLPENRCEDQNVYPGDSLRRQCQKDECGKLVDAKEKDGCFFRTAQSETKRIVNNDAELAKLNQDAKYIGLAGILPLNIIISIVIFLIKDKNDCVWPSELWMTFAGFVQSIYEVVEFWTSSKDLIDLNNKYQNASEQLSTYRYFRDKERLTLKYLIARISTQILTMSALAASMTLAIYEYKDPTGATCTPPETRSGESQPLLGAEGLPKSTDINASPSASGSRMVDTRNSKNVVLNRPNAQVGNSLDHSIEDKREENSFQKQFDKEGDSGRFGIVLSHAGSFIATCVLLFSFYARYYKGAGKWVKYGRKAKLTAAFRATAAGLQIALIYSLNILLAILMGKVVERIEKINSLICDINKAINPLNPVDECSLDPWTLSHQHQFFPSLFSSFIMSQALAQSGELSQNNKMIIPLICLNQKGAFDQDCHCRKNKNCLEINNQYLSKIPARMKNDKQFMLFVKDANLMMNGEKSISDTNPLDSVANFVHFKKLFDSERKEIMKNKSFQQRKIAIPTFSEMVSNHMSEIKNVVNENVGLNHSSSYMFMKQNDAETEKKQKLIDELVFSNKPLKEIEELFHHKKEVQSVIQTDEVRRRTEDTIPPKIFNVDSVLKNERLKIWDVISNRYKKKMITVE